MDLVDAWKYEDEGGSNNFTYESIWPKFFYCQLGIFKVE